MTVAESVFENLRLELRRGCLTLAVLAQLRQEHYGYTLRKALVEQGMVIDESTLYPLLRRLESQGLLRSEWREEDKRNKRFYRLSQEGQPIFAQLLQEWHDHQQRYQSDSVNGARGNPMMQTQVDLFERYLQAIRRHLPWRRQDDILAELRVNLEAQLEDKEEERGRPLTEGEMIDWLKQLGSPMHVAMRYRPQQYLIGPAIFPMYWYVIRLTLPLTAVIFTVVNGLLIATQTSGVPSIAEAISRLPGVLINAVAWITAAFVGLDFVISHKPNDHLPLSAWSRNWNPSA